MALILFLFYHRCCYSSNIPQQVYLQPLQYKHTVTVVHIHIYTCMYIMYVHAWMYIVLDTCINTETQSWYHNYSILALVPIRDTDKLYLILVSALIQDTVMEIIVDTGICTVTRYWYLHCHSRPVLASTLASLYQWRSSVSTGPFNLPCNSLN